MRRKGSIPKMREQEKSSEKDLSEMEATKIQGESLKQLLRGYSRTLGEEWVIKMRTYTKR